MTQTVQDRTSARAARAASADETYRPPYGAAGIAALAILALYAVTLGPTTHFWDTSEYIATGHILGIPHPPGNPLFVVLARAWELLLAPTGLSTAARINLFSAAMSALAHGCWFLVMHRVMWAVSDRKFVRLAGAAMAVLVSATAFTVWNQSNVNEKVYTVSLFTIALLTWLAFRWRDRIEGTGLPGGPRAGESSDAAETATPRAGARRPAATDDDTGWYGVGAGVEGAGNLLLLSIFILALSVGNHLMAFLVAPALFVLIVMVDYRTLFDWRLYAFGAALAVLGLSIHLYLPLRASLDPVINEADPSTMQALWEALTRQQYDKPSVLLNPIFYPSQELPRGPGLIVAQFGHYIQYFDWQWARSIAGNVSLFGGFRPIVTLLFAGLGAYGAWTHYRKERTTFWYMAVLFLTLSVALTFYLNFKYGYSYTLGAAADAPREYREVRERDYFFVVSFSLWGLWAGMGVTLLWRRLARWVEEVRSDSPASGTRRLGRRAYALAAPILVIGLIPLFANWGWASRAGDYSARDWAYNLLMSVEPYGVLFTNGDNDTFPLWYLQEVEGIRQDVTVIVTSYLNTAWYAKQLRQLTTPCPEGVDPGEDPTRIICQRPYEPEEGPDFYAEMLAAPDSLGPGHRPPTESIFDLAEGQIDQVANTGPFPIGEGRAFQAGDITTPLAANRVMLPSDLFMIAILRSAIDDRPIYFATTTNAYEKLNLSPHLIRQGVAFKLHDGPVETDSTSDVVSLRGDRLEPITGPYIDLPRSDALMWDVFVHRGGIPDEWDHWVDHSTQGIPVYYAYLHYAAANAHARRGAEEEVDRHVERGDAWYELASK